MKKIKNSFKTILEHNKLKIEDNLDREEQNVL